MDTGGEAGDVYRLVFELTARATDVPYDTFLRELVAGLAAHYRAELCRLHIGGAGRAVATADPGARLAKLSPPELARFDTLDAMLAEAVKKDGVLRTALDLDGGEEICNFLNLTLKTGESFAFPLTARGRAFGAVTLYLPDVYPFGEADVRGLQAIGNVLYAAGHQNAPEALGGEPVPVKSDKLRSYQEALERIGKVLDELHFLTGAGCVYLLDTEGDFIAKRGEESRLASAAFASVVASGFAAARRLAGIYGAHEARSVLHEGDAESVFVIEVADRALLCVVHRGHGAPGLTTRWARATAQRLAEQVKALRQVRVA
ncbi:MAG: roadblock/LC7 domain-containing protein [Planctomycetaceae bacterium]